MITLRLVKTILKAATTIPRGLQTFDSLEALRFIGHLPQNLRVSCMNDPFKKMRERLECDRVTDFFFIMTMIGQA